MLEATGGSELGLGCSWRSGSSARKSCGTRSSRRQDCVDTRWRQSRNRTPELPQRTEHPRLSDPPSEVRIERTRPGGSRTPPHLRRSRQCLRPRPWVGDSICLKRPSHEACRRHKTVEKWCKKQGIKPPGKAAIANKVLEHRGDKPLLEPTKRSTLRSLHKRVAKQLDELQLTGETAPAVRLRRVTNRAGVPHRRAAGACSGSA